MLNLALILVDICGLSTLALALHCLSPRYGFAPLLVFLGGLTVILQGQIGIFVEPAAGFTLFLSSNVLVPVLLVSVLVIYVADGAVPARMTIYCILGISVLVLGIQQLYRTHLALPGGGALSVARTDVLFPPLNLRVATASLVAFACDMLMIAIFYQTLKNRAPRWPDWLVIGLALVAGLWTDSIVFSTFADWGKPDFGQYLPGDLAGKTLSAVALWPGTALYLTFIAPRFPGYVGAKNRRAFDLLLGSIELIKLTLVRTEAALHASEAQRQREAEYLRLISDNIHEALWISKPNQANAYYVNPAYEAIWGRSAQTIYDDPLAFINSVFQEDRKRVSDYLASQALALTEIEYRLVRPDGEIRWVRERAIPVRGEAGDVTRVVGITEDITERKLAEQRRVDLAIEQGKVQLLRSFISETSQDFKNPLTALHLRAFQLARTPEAEKRTEFLEEMRKQITRMQRSLEEILTLARLASPTVLPVIEWDVQSLLRDLHSQMSFEAQAKNIAFTTEVEVPPVRLSADREDLARALAHLLENAIAYTPNGGAVHVAVHITAAELEIAVQDSGVGVAPEELPHIFDRFYRGATASQLQPVGTGLGLAIVHRVVEQHRGRVQVESQTGTGTTFKIYLPLATRA